MTFLHVVPRTECVVDLDCVACAAVGELLGLGAVAELGRELTGRDALLVLTGGGAAPFPEGRENTGDALGAIESVPDVVGDRAALDVHPPTANAAASSMLAVDA